MSFLSKTILYLIDLLRKNKDSDIYFKICKHNRRGLERFLIRRIKTTLSIILILLLIMAASVASRFIGPPKARCEYVNIDPVFAPAGDNLVFQGERACETHSLVAFEVISRDKGRFANSKIIRPNLVSADLFIRANIIGEGRQLKRWRNFSFYAPKNKGGNDAIFKESQDDDGEAQYRFIRNTCDLDDNESSKLEDRVNTKGMELEGTVPFAGRSLDEKARHRCDSNNFKDPANIGCNFSFLHLYIPSIEPKRLCKQRNWLDKWINRGTKRFNLADDETIEHLRAFASNRFDENKAQSMSDEAWHAAIDKLPKFCGHREGLKGEYIVKDSVWQEEGSIISVWCDPEE